MAPDELSRLMYGAVTWMVIAVIQELRGANETILDWETPAQRDARMLSSMRFWTGTLASVALGAVLVYWCRVAAGERFLVGRPVAAGLFWGGALVASSFVLQYVWWNLVRRMGRVRALCALVPVFALLFALPASLEYRDYKDDLAARRAAVAAWDSARAHEEQWLTDLKSAGLIGRRGLFPPMLDVEDLGKTVVLQNRSEATLCVAVARADDDRRCELHTAKRAHCAELAPGMRASFTWRDSGDFGSCGNLPLDFRVGDFTHDEVLWWSASALDLAMADAQLEHQRRRAFVDGGEEHASLRALSLADIQAQTRRAQRLKDGAEDRTARWQRAAAKWRAREQQLIWETMSTHSRGQRHQEIRRMEIASRHQRVLVLRAQGATAPPGVVPEMLEVRDQFSLVRVRNRASEALVVRLTRLGSRLSDGNPFVCFGRPMGGAAVELFAALAPGQTTAFLVTNFEVCEPVGKAPLEFEVRDRHGELLWATSSVLDRWEQEARGQEPPDQA